MTYCVLYCTLSPLCIGVYPVRKEFARSGKNAFLSEKTSFQRLKGAKKKLKELFPLKLFYSPEITIYLPFYQVNRQCTDFGGIEKNE